MTIAKQISCLKKDFKDLLVVPKSQTISFALSINYCHHLKKRLEKRLESISVFISFINDSDIFDITLAIIKPPETGFTLLHRHCHYSRIKDFISAICSLSEYIWEVILYMVLTSKEYLGPDIWLEVVDQAKNIEDIIKRIWAIEANYLQKASGTNAILLTLSDKKAKHISLFTSYYMTIIPLI